MEDYIIVYSCHTLSEHLGHMICQSFSSGAKRSFRIPLHGSRDWGQMECGLCDYLFAGDGFGTIGDGRIFWGANSPAG